MKSATIASIKLTLNINSYIFSIIRDIPIPIPIPIGIYLYLYAYTYMRVYTYMQVYDSWNNIPYYTPA